MQACNDCARCQCLKTTLAERSNVRETTHSCGRQSCFRFADLLDRHVEASGPKKERHRIQDLGRTTGGGTRATSDHQRTTKEVDSTSIYTAAVLRTMASRAAVRQTARVVTHHHRLSASRTRAPVQSLSTLVSSSSLFGGGTNSNSNSTTVASWSNSSSSNNNNARWFSSPKQDGSNSSVDQESTQQNKQTTTSAEGDPDTEEPVEPVRSASSSDKAGATDADGGNGNTDEQQQPPQSPPLSKEEQLEAEIKKLKDQLLRTLADQENTRRIAHNDVSTAKKFAIKSFAKSLLDVSDNLERALQAIPDGMEQQKEDHPVLFNLYEGVKLTEDGLVKAFASNGLVRFGKPGELFDPNKHEALYEYPDPTKKPGTVGQVMKSGFMLNDRVLRPAEVGVVKKES